MAGDTSGAFRVIRDDGGGSVGVLKLDYADGQVVDTSGTSAASAIFDENTSRLVEMCANADFWYTVDESPTASAGAGSQFVPKGAYVYVFVPSNYKIAVIQDAATGKVAMVPSI